MIDWIEAFGGVDNAWQLLKCDESREPLPTCKLLFDNVYVLCKQQINAEMSPEQKAFKDNGGCRADRIYWNDGYEVAPVEWRRS